MKILKKKNCGSKKRREKKERQESRLEHCEVIASDTDGETTNPEGQRVDR